MSGAQVSGPKGCPMNYRMLVIGFLVCVFLVGCAIPKQQTMWSKIGSSREEFERDKEACRQKSIREGRGEYGNIDGCLQGKGWVLVKEPQR